MKKTFMAVFLSLTILFSNGCLLFNVLGLNPGHEKGTVAAARIQEKAITMSLLRRTGFPLAFMADTLAGIKPNSYYKTRDVDACIDKMYSLEGVLLGSGLTAKFLCDIPEDNILLDP